MTKLIPTTFYILLISISTTVELFAIDQSCPDIVDYIDKTYGAGIRQINNPNGHEHNIYYHRNPWNADNTYLIGIKSDINQKNWKVVLYNGKGCFIKELFSIENYDWRLVWDRNDPKIFYTWKGSNLYRYNVDTDKADLLKSFAPLGLKVCGPSLNQTGDRILVITSDEIFHSYHIPDMQDERTFAVGFQSGCFTDWEDERYIGYGNYIVTGCNSKDWTTEITYIYDDTGKLYHKFDGISFPHKDFSPDGKWAYFKMPTYARRGGNVTSLEIHLVNIDGTDDKIVYTVSQLQAGYIRNLHLSWPDKVNNWFIASFFPSAEYLPKTYTPPLDEILLINIDGTYKYLCRTETTVSRGFSMFWAEPLASSSSDGTRINFNSNRSGTIDQYILFMEKDK
ncbi:MAG: hypothetical protein AABY84_05900 [Candidatus Firestonebacteria bacterium]|mgnify:CR=1 FL=1